MTRLKKDTTSKSTLSSKNKFQLNISSKTQWKKMLWKSKWFPFLLLGKIWIEDMRAQELKNESYFKWFSASVIG